MSNDEHADELPEWADRGQLGRLTYSLANLTELARAPPLVATAINVACIALGVGIWAATSGLVAAAGAVFAILSFLGIVKWVVGL